MTLARGGRGRRFAWSSAVAAGVAFVLIACGSVKQRGELMLAMQTDLELPKDVDTVRIEVTELGKTLFQQDYPVGPDGVKIPATLGVVGDPNNAGAPIEVRVIASQSGTLRVLRNVTTTVPPDRTAILRMPLAWLCWNQVTTDSSNTPQSSCPAGQTCIAGECAANGVDSTQLEAFDPSEVFGGSSDASGGACLDTIACFAQGVLAAVDTSDCSIAKPAGGGAGINVGLIRKPGVPGICSPEACYVPLDEDPQEGWSDGGDKILLPPAVCSRLAEPASSKISIVGVVVTTSCATKTPSTPTCGPWSSVGGSEGTFEAGTPAGFDAGPNTDFVGTWTAQGLGGTEACGGNYTSTLTIAQDDNGLFSIDETDGPVVTADGTCQAVTQTGLQGTLNADGTLSYTPSLAPVCTCSGAALTVTLSISPDGVLNASDAFSGITECPSFGSTSTTPDSGVNPPEDASTTAPDSGKPQRIPLGASDDAGSGSGGDGSNSGICSSCSDTISCTVDLSYVRQGTESGGHDGGTTAPTDAGVGFGADSGTLQECNGTTCSGCCDADGVCQPGFTQVACGVDGVACANCQSLGGTCGETGQCQAAGDDASAPTDAGPAKDGGAKLPDGG